MEERLDSQIQIYISAGFPLKDDEILSTLLSMHLMPYPIVLYMTGHFLTMPNTR